MCGSEWIDVERGARGFERMERIDAD